MRTLALLLCLSLPLSSQAYTELLVGCSQREDRDSHRPHAAFQLNISETEKEITFPGFDFKGTCFQPNSHFSPLLFVCPILVVDTEEQNNGSTDYKVVQGSFVYRGPAMPGYLRYGEQNGLDGYTYQVNCSERTR